MLQGFIPQFQRFEAKAGDAVFREGDASNEGFYIALSSVIGGKG